MATAASTPSRPIPHEAGPPVSVVVTWPIAVSLDEDADLCEARDVTSLAAALVRLGLPDRSQMPALDLMVVFLKPITFGPVDPAISVHLRDRARDEEVAPACCVALDLHVAAALGRWTPPRWIQDYLDGLVLSKDPDLPPKRQPMHTARAARSIR